MGGNSQDGAGRAVAGANLAADAAQIAGDIVVLKGQHGTAMAGEDDGKWLLYHRRDLSFTRDTKNIFTFFYSIRGILKIYKRN